MHSSADKYCYLNGLSKDIVTIKRSHQFTDKLYIHVHFDLVSKTNLRFKTYFIPRDGNTSSVIDVVSRILVLQGLKLLDWLFR